MGCRGDLAVAAAYHMGIAGAVSGVGGAFLAIGRPATGVAGVGGAWRTLADEALVAGDAFGVAVTKNAVAGALLIDRNLAGAPNAAFAHPTTVGAGGQRRFAWTFAPFVDAGITGGDAKVGCDVAGVAVTTAPLVAGVSRQ